MILSASDVGADASGTATSVVNAHNTSTTSHNDIRLLIEGLTTRLNALADSDDTTLDQMSEIVTYIKSNKTLIEGITTSKVNVTDIINNLTTNASNKPLSAAQGVALKSLIDAIVVPTKVSQLINDKGYITSIPLTQEAGESESLVMSQQAVTNLVAEAIGTGGGTSTEYETVDSVEKMTDTSKQYVLSTTGTIWDYVETDVFVENNEFNVNTAKLNTRIKTNGTEETANGVVATDYIEVVLTSPYNVTFSGLAAFSHNTNTAYALHMTYFDSAKSRLGGVILHQGSALNLPKTFDIYNASYTSAKYVRFVIGINASSTITTSDCANLKINCEAKNTISRVGEWQDSGITPSSSGGGNYVDLLVKINDNATHINEINSRVTALESGSETLTVPSFWENAVKSCINKINAVQVDRNCVTFPFFSDNHKNNRYAGVLIAYIMKECNIPYCFFGGDAISNGSDVVSESVMITQDHLFDEMMSVIPVDRMCRTVGNHDAYWNPTPDSGSSTRVYYDRGQIYNLFLRQESISQNKHYGGDGTYYYVDDLASKTRFVLCNTNFNVNTSIETLDTEQISWLENEAMVFDKSGWSLVFISHQPITNHYHSNIYAETATAIQTLLTNYANNSDTYKAEIVGWFSGHIHADRIYTGAAANTTDDSIKNTLPWKTVTIRADNTGLCRDEALKHTVANDDQSHAIDFVTINKTTRTVNITRLGIGNDRSYTY